MRSVPSLPKKSASAVYVTLTAQVAATAALVVFEQARGRRLAREISALGGDPHAPGAQALAGAVSVFAVLVMLAAATTVAAVAAYLTWLVQARQSAVPGAPAGRVLAAWAVPAVNLIAPPALVHRLWRDSRPPVGHHGRWAALLAAWWLSWLTLLALVLTRPPLGTPGDSELTGLGPAELATVTVSALLCAATVRQITRIQTMGAGRARRAPAGPAAPQALSRLLTEQGAAQQAQH